MQTMKRITLPLIVTLLTVGLVIGCGDSKRNDQGVSFTFLGWFVNDPDEPCGAGLTGINFPVGGAPGQAATFPDSADQFGALFGTVAAQAGLRNHLLGEFIRTEQIYHDYRVPGASVAIPSTSVALGVVIAPATGSSAGPGTSDGGGFGVDFGENSTVPDTADDPVGDGEEGTPNTVCAAVPLVTNDIINFLTFNRDSLPELPFVLEVRSRALGITSSGESIESNPINFEIVFNVDNSITPTEGTGGDVVDDGDDEGEEEATGGATGTVEEGSDAADESTDDAADDTGGFTDDTEL